MNQTTTLKMEQKFKKTPVGEIPMDWELVTLSDVCSPGDQKFNPVGNEGIPYVGLEHINSSGKLIATGNSSEVTSLKTRFRAGSILFGKLRPYLQKIVKVNFDGVCSTDIMVIDPSQGVSADYMLYVLQSDASVNHAVGTSGGTKMPRTSWPLFSKYVFPLPPINEQHKIAEILSAVDDAIEKTDALIEKTQQLKKGLMQQLFTSGIDELGRIRNPTSKPEAFKSTTVGAVPKTWEVQPIGNKLRKIIDYRGKTPSKTDSGIPLITAKNVREGYIEWEPAEYIASDDYERWMTRGIPNEGDVLFTTEAPLGNVALVPSGKVALAQRILTLCCEPSMLDSQFLFWLLQAPHSRISIEQRATGTTVHGIKQSVFRKVELPFPPLDEQKRIAQTLSCLEQHDLSETRYCKYLDQMKQALMQVLLTGKVRLQAST